MFCFLEDCYRRTVIVDGEEVTLDILDRACRVSKSLYTPRKLRPPPEIKGVPQLGRIHPS